LGLVNDDDDDEMMMMMMTTVTRYVSLEINSPHHHCELLEQVVGLLEQVLAALYQHWLSHHSRRTHVAIDSRRTPGTSGRDYGNTLCALFSLSVS